MRVGFSGLAVAKGDSPCTLCDARLETDPFAAVNTVPVMAEGKEVCTMTEPEDGMVNNGVVPITVGRMLAPTLVLTLRFSPLKLVVLLDVVAGMAVLATAACRNNASCPCCVLDIGALTSCNT